MHKITYFISVSMYISRYAHIIRLQRSVRQLAPQPHAAFTEMPSCPTQQRPIPGVRENQAQDNSPRDNRYRTPRGVSREWLLLVYKLGRKPRRHGPAQRRHCRPGPPRWGRCPSPAALNPAPLRPSRAGRAPPPRDGSLCLPPPFDGARPLHSAGAGGKREACGCSDPRRFLPPGPAPRVPVRAGGQRDGVSSPEKRR